MIFDRARTAAGAAIGTLFLSLAVPTSARSQPAPRFTQSDVPDLAAMARPLPTRTTRDLRSPDVEREHLRALRIISRVCSGC